MPAAGGVSRALERGRETGCEIVQIFVKNNLQWFSPPLTPAELELYFQQKKAHPFHCVFGHAGYLINLAAPASPKRERSLQSLVQEIQRAGALDLPFLVLHPGAHLGQGEKQGLRQVVRGLNQVLRTTRDSPVRLALENTAGQGTCLGGDLDHLFAIREAAAAPERLGFCLDTAHLFAAGHDIRTPEGWENVLDRMQSHAGLAAILAFHLNDSKAPLGARVDRHAGIGQGCLGMEPFRFLLQDPRLAHHPGCLETPKSPDLHEDRENLARLRALIQGETSIRRFQPRNTPNTLKQKELNG